MSERRISYAPDVENGEHQHDDTAGLDEYAALNRYISTAQRQRRDSTGSGGAGEEDGEKKTPWWKFWAKKGDGAEAGFECPDEWLETDIKQGISASDVEPRRRRSGWNELATEKTNFFIQFIGYFRGPILYGK